MLTQEFANLHAWLKLQTNIPVERRIEINKFIFELIKADQPKWESIADLFDNYLRNHVTAYQRKKILGFLKNRNEIIENACQELGQKVW